MVKLVFLCRRRPDLDHARYVDLLLRGHVPLALRHHPTLRRYVVNIVESTRGPAPPLDSIGELCIDSLADYRERLYDSPDGQQIIARDVAGFLGGADTTSRPSTRNARRRRRRGSTRCARREVVACVAHPGLGRDDSGGTGSSGTCRSHSSITRPPGT
jgi:hypothetical protein